MSQPITGRDLTSTWGVDAFSNPGVARFRKQLDAETWANGLTLASLGTIPLGNRSGATYQRCMALMPHNQLARRVWLLRLKGETYESPRDWFPVLSVEETEAMCHENDRAWAAYIDGLKDSALTRAIDYSASDGTGYRSVVDDVILHVFNHSTYHRGQVARLVTECGGQRASTDYIAFSRIKL
jgi:uncharacterized damage-inducible protein DinB